MTDEPDATPQTASDDTRHDPSSPFTAPVRHPTGTDRRTLLRAAGLITVVGGGGAVLAACATTDTPATPAPSGVSSSAASSPSAEASSAAPSGTKTSAAAKTPGGPSVAESSVPEGSGVIMHDADFVVTQPSQGEFKAFSKICTHQQCAVSEVTDTIDCLCHGSKFSITDGSVVDGPASQPLAESRTKVSGGMVYVQA